MAGRQGVAGGECLWGHAALGCSEGAAMGLVEAQAGAGEPGVPAGGQGDEPPWSQESKTSQWAGWAAVQGLDKGPYPPSLAKALGFCTRVFAIGGRSLLERRGRLCV